MPGRSQKSSVSPLLNILKLRGIRELVGEIRAGQKWKASGVGSKPKAPVSVNDLTNSNIEDIM